MKDFMGGVGFALVALAIGWMIGLSVRVDHVEHRQDACVCAPPDAGVP